jgi:hypothetical protein
MSFLDNIRERELEKNRMSAWSQSVTHLCRFIRQHLREAELTSPLRIKADLLRVEKILFNRLTIFLNGETVSVTALPLHDPRTPQGGGCILVQSTNKVTYNLLWNGISSAVDGNWEIARVDDNLGAKEVQVGSLTVFFDQRRDESRQLSGASLDEALGRLFGLPQHLEPRGNEDEGSRRIQGSLAPFSYRQRPTPFSQSISDDAKRQTPAPQ